MNKYLVKLANHLDTKGLYKEAEYVDFILRKNYKKAGFVSGLKNLFNHMMSNSEDGDALSRHFEVTGDMVMFSDESPIFAGQTVGYDELMSKEEELMEKEERGIMSLIKEPDLVLQFFVNAAAMKAIGSGSESFSDMEDDQF